jgi:radical SAM superfamily enzyme YgiQ (UPF0313 family)
MRKKVLLIEPGTKITTYPPIGLLHLASAIRNEYSVFIKDYSGMSLDEVLIRKTLKKINPFVVGLRVLTGPGIPRALLISEIAKDLGISVIWGGPHPTILPEQTLENKNIDAVCIGEGEYALIDLLKYFEGKIKTVYGAGIKEKEKIIIFPPQKKIVDFENLALPSWDLLEDIDRYFPKKQGNSLPLSTTRGCPFKCGFCHNSNKNVKQYLGCYRIAPPKKAIEELKFIRKLVKNKIDFIDVGEDFHLISKDYAKKFCEEIKNSGIKNLKWNTSTRYSVLNKEIINLIAKHNCKEIMLGVESGSKRIQKINGKIVDFDHAIKIAKLLKEKKIFTRNTYIFGHPTESVEELNQTLKFIKKIPCDENLIQLYRPMPKTPYFDLCLKENKITNIPKKLKDWSGFGIFGQDINVSRIPDKILFSTFYKTNAIQQTKYLFNQQKYYLREGMYLKFLKNFINNRFTHKLKEYIENKK